MKMVRRRAQTSRARTHLLVSRKVAGEAAVQPVKASLPRCFLAFESGRFDGDLDASESLGHRAPLSSSVGGILESCLVDPWDDSPHAQLGGSDLPPSIGLVESHYRGCVQARWRRASLGQRM